MQAIRTIKKVRDKKITIDLPEDFVTGEVEIIILPVEKSIKETVESISKFLLTGPFLDDNGIKEIEYFQKWYHNWEIK